MTVLITCEACGRTFTEEEWEEGGGHNHYCPNPLNWFIDQCRRVWGYRDYLKEKNKIV